MKLLIVEDEKRLCQTVAKHLKDEGYTVDMCYDGSDAPVSYTHLHTFRQNKDCPVASRCRNGGKTDARISAGGLNDGSSGFQDTFFFCVQNHRKRRPVFNTSGRIHSLQLSVNRRLAPSAFLNGGKPEKRCISNGFNNRIIKHFAHLLIFPEL